MAMCSSNPSIRTTSKSLDLSSIQPWFSFASCSDLRKRGPAYGHGQVFEVNQACICLSIVGQIFEDQSYAGWWVFIERSSLDVESRSGHSTSTVVGVFI